VESLTGKTAVITGGASGMGRAFADRFGAAGMRIVLADIEQAALEAAADELRGAGVDVVAVRTDVSSETDVARLAEAAIERGPVNVLCLNAGVGGGGGLIGNLTAADWQWTLGVNVWGIIHGLAKFLPHLKSHGDGQRFEPLAFEDVVPVVELRTGGARLVDRGQEVDAESAPVDRVQCGGRLGEMQCSATRFGVGGFAPCERHVGGAFDPIGDEKRRTEHVAGCVEPTGRGDGHTSRAQETHRVELGRQRRFELTRFGFHEHHAAVLVFAVGVMPAGGVRERLARIADR